MKKHTILSLIVLIILGTFSPVFYANASSPEGVRLSWQHDPQTTITVMWRTSSNSTPATVQYGTSTALGQTKNGANTESVESGFYYHTAELTGLTPATTYYYRVLGDGNTWSPTYSFKTAPSTNTPFSFTAFADNGIDETSYRQAYTIKTKIAAENPAFHVVAGDISYADGDWCDGKPCFGNHWDEWHKESETYASKTPTVMALGNHDDKPEVVFSSGELFYQRSFALPPENNELYYSFDYGDAHFTILNSEDESGLKGGTQYNWAVNDLTNTNKTWKIVVLHKTTYSNGEHGSDRGIQDWLSPIFDQYNVDLVINGHDHLYERTLPLRSGSRGSFNAPVIATQEKTNYGNLDATIYVTTGAGGRGFYSFKTNYNWDALRNNSKHEYIKVDVSGSTLTFHAIEVDGPEFDTFTISKNGSTAPAPVPAPTTPSPTPTSNYTANATQGVAANMQIKGFNYPSWWFDEFLNTDSQTSLNNMKNTGANWAAVAPFWYQANKTSTEIKHHTSGKKTATDESVRSIIRYARSQNIHVALKPMVDAEDGTWRGEFVPANADQWFTSYRSFIMNYAQMAQDEGVELLFIGTELRQVTKPEYTERWRSIIRDIRGVYSGALTYDANWEGEYEHIEFWNNLDTIALSAYFPVATKNTATLSELKASWQENNGKHWYQDLEAIHNKFNKPVMFGEIGYQSRDGATQTPWNRSGSLDLEEQALAYEAAISFWKDVPWFKGMFFWHWSTKTRDGGTSNTDWVSYGKPAETVLKTYWVAAGNQVTTPASNPVPASTPTSNPAPAPAPVPTTNNSKPAFAYGLARRPLVIEQRAALELERELKTRFFPRGIPLAAHNWPVYINAYLYGHYPVEAIGKAIKFGGKTVHPTIPWTAWRNHSTYKLWMGR